MKPRMAGTRRTASFFVLALSLATLGFGSTHAQGVTPASPAASAEGCAALDRAEADGRRQLERRISDVDKAAASGDTAAFCEAASDLLFVYAAMRQTAAGCSPARQKRWSDAETQTRKALAGTCPRT